MVSKVSLERLEGHLWESANILRGPVDAAELLTLRFQLKPSADWLAALAAAGVPAGPVLTIAEMLEYPQVRARAMVVETQHPKTGAGVQPPGRGHDL